MDDGKTRLTRRGLLQAALPACAALALPELLLPSARGESGRPAASGRIAMGAIGLGGRGMSDLGWLLGESDVQVLAVADVSRGRRDGAKQAVDARYGNRDCAAYRDFRELLDRPDIDAVLIATGDRWHAPASVLAMRAGKDVYCEKPSAFSLQEGRTVVETARRYGRVYQTGTQRLSEPHHVAAIELARSGRLGNVHTIYADCRWRGGFRRDWLPAEAQPARDELDWDLWVGPCVWHPYNHGYLNSGWYNFYDYATDVAMWGAHTIAQALAGVAPLKAPVEIVYDASRPDILVRLSDGVKMMLVREGDCGSPCKYWSGSCGERFEGPEGWVAAADGYSKPAASSPALVAEYRKVVADYAGRTGRSLNHVRDFLDCVKSRRLTVANPEVMNASMAIALAADISLQLKRTVKLDIAAAEFLGDAEANRLRERAVRRGWEERG